MWRNKSLTCEKGNRNLICIFSIKANNQGNFNET